MRPVERLFIEPFVVLDGGTQFEARDRCGNRNTGARKTMVTCKFCPKLMSMFTADSYSSQTLYSVT